MALNLPSYSRFKRSLRQPGTVQRRMLAALVAENASTLFGKAHGFEKIDSYERFASQVPLAGYEAFEPWIARIRRGESGVLTREPVTRLVPTSGSTGGRKLIPFTTGLQTQFNAAIGAWLADLAGTAPGLLAGRAYWSITPVIGRPEPEDSAVPIGFDSDTDYLGGGRRALADAVMAVPAKAGKAETAEAFRRETLLHLLRCADLRLISVWHPSFLALLLDELPTIWESALDEIEHGTDSTPPSPRRARELRAAHPLNPRTIWPELRVVSCWGHGAATPSLADLKRRFPGTLFQPKGLIATEAFVTVPFARQYPLAVTSHFFEFIDDHGRVFPAESLQLGNEYEVAVTTAGGLWRYRLGDRVRVTGFAGSTPALEFLGRQGGVSDRFGEKLSETFVIEALREALGAAAPPFAMLAPDEDERGCRYALYVEGEVRAHWAASLDHALRRNPHYAYCRDLGQLRPVRVVAVAGRAYETFARHQARNGARLGDIKPVALSTVTGWSHVFASAAAGAEQAPAESRN